MSDLAGDLKKAVKEFEDLTNKRAATLKNKGKEDGIKKLAVLFKSGKTLEQRASEYDKAYNASDKAKAENADKVLKELLTTRQKFSEGLKKNIADYTAQAKVISPADADMKAGFEIFIKRLNQFHNHAKMAADQKEKSLRQLAGKGMGVDESLKKDLRITYVGLRKGIEETEALMKKFIAKPTKENMAAAFTSSTGPRSISVSVTYWKQMVLKRNPGINKNLPADPEYLLKHIFDLTQQKGTAFWDKQVQTDKAGWEDRAKKVAQDCIKQLANWRRMADEIKKLAA
jgi:hypothetical protein